MKKNGLKLCIQAIHFTVGGRSYPQAQSNIYIPSMNKTISIIRLFRPHQFIKNGFVLLPLFFGHKLHDVDSFYEALQGFTVFCFISSSVYIINDYFDRESDRRHPVKQFRPLASGSVKPWEALALFVILLLISGTISTCFLPIRFTLYVIIYLVLNIAYSTYLKQFAIIDIFCISSGFVIRVFAGGEAVNVQVSHWLVIMTFLTALFIALGKRMDDLKIVEKGHSGIRKNLDGYTMEFISNAMMIMASVIIVAYLLYTLSPEVMEKHKSNILYLTCFFVIAGILRYMQIVFVKNQGGAPTLLLLRDIPLQAIIITWTLSYYFILYQLGK